MRHQVTRFLGLAVCLCVATGIQASPPSRTFAFRYETRVTQIPAEARVLDLWLPLPQSDPNQTISSLRIDSPVPIEITREPEYGNSVLHVRAANPGKSELPVALEIVATRRQNAGNKEPLDEMARRRLLAADRLVPVDGKIRALAVQVTRGKRTDREKAQAIYDHVTSSMRYDKTGEGWGRGDAVHACDVRKGNCTDFHSLIIGMARAVGIPARFSIGFPLPEKHGEGQVAGYHCWAELYVDGSWLPVDSSEAAKNPARKDYFFGHHDENRIEFTTGRDLRLQPEPREGPLNYFIYPLAEVDGMPHLQVDRKFSFRDLGTVARSR
jgi:transglutaminase-like putative cysteine protease